MGTSRGQWGWQAVHSRQAVSSARAVIISTARTSVFIDTSLDEISADRYIGVDLVEINTGLYADLREGRERDKALAAVAKAAAHGRGIGLEVHGGHGLDYRNVGPIVAIPEIEELSIGFSIVARAAVVGVERAVLDMLALLT